MKKSIRNSLNNIEWKGGVADLTSEWQKRECYLVKHSKGWCVLDNKKGTRLRLGSVDMLPSNDVTMYSSTLEILNHRLNKIKERGFLTMPVEKFYASKQEQS